MGARMFFKTGHGKTPADAFNEAREESLHEYGHGGYSGSLAEKTSFVVIPLPGGQVAHKFAEDLCDEDDQRISDKHGPAGCIWVAEGKYLFFGFASD